MLLNSYSKIVFLAFVSVILVACSYNFLPKENFFDSDVSNTFETVLDIIGNDDISALKDVAIPEFSEAENFDESMGKILQLAGNPEGAQLVLAENRRVDRSADAEKVFYAAYEYQNGSNFELLQIAIQQANGECCFLRHIKFNQDDFKRSAYHGFRSQDLNFKRLAFLALMIFTITFILSVMVLIIRDKNLKSKWFWILFALFGSYGATLNWTTAEIAPNFFQFNQGGGVHLSLVKFNLLGGGFTRSGLFHPWMFDWGFPLGAAIYVIKHKILRQNSKLAVED